MKNSNLFIRTITVLLFAILMPQIVNAESGKWELKFVMDSDNSGQHLLYPNGLFVDKTSERYYIVDSGRNRLLSFNKDGNPLSAFDAGGKFENPIAAVRDSNGRMIIVEKGKGSVTLVDFKNKKVEPFIIRRPKQVFPQRLQINKDDLFVLDKRSGAVLLLDEKFAVVRGYRCSDCLAGGFIDFKIENSSVYALSVNGKLFQFDLQGKLISSIALNPRPDFAAAFTVSDDGQIFVVERHAGKVLVYHKNGRFDYSFLSHGQKADQLYYPVQMDFDPWGRLCIVDEGNGRVGVFAR